MKYKRILALISFISIFATLFSNVSSIQIEYKKTDIIFVDDDANSNWYNDTNFKRIQDAINASKNGDTIYVYNGTYYENIVIDKTISLIGENKYATIIDGKQKTDTVYIKSEKVEITGFTITNSSRDEWYYAGIRLTSSNIEIKDNIIKDNNLGVFGKKVTNTIVYKNSFINDSLTFSLYDIENEPVIFSEKYFIHFVQFNTVNGKPLIYVRNQKNINIPGDAGQVIAVSCEGLKIQNMVLDYSDFGIILVNSKKCEIKNNSISHCDGMIWLINSSENTIKNNNISNNFEGICIDQNSNNNIIINNMISKNRFYGIIIEGFSHNNKILKNDFIKNFQEYSRWQVFFRESHGNRWDSNFWNQKRILPKIIMGNRDFLGYSIPLIPWIDIDFRPALKPNTE